jgi:HlyD family secretion protein
LNVRPVFLQQRASMSFSPGKLAAIIAAIPLVAVAALGGISIGASEPRYMTARIEQGDLRTILTATGTLQAVITAKVGSQLSGQIEELFVTFNDAVKQGQPMARLDSRTYEARLRGTEAALEVAEARTAMARAALERAQSEVSRATQVVAVTAARIESIGIRTERLRTASERKQELGERGAIGRVQVDDAVANLHSAMAELRSAQAERSTAEGAVRSLQATVKIAQAELTLAEANVRQLAASVDQAKTDLSNTVIRATIDGVVIGRDVERGQTVAATLEAPTLFLIAQDLRQMEVHARIDEADIGRIKLAQPAFFTVDSYPGRAFSARVSQIRKAPQLVQNVVTYTVVMSAQNSDSILLPGMTAVVQITTQQVENAVKIPNAALRYRPPQSQTRTPERAIADASPAGSKGQFVWSLGPNDTPVPVRIELGVSDSFATELVSGNLAPGQLIIVGNAAPERRGSFWALPWTP